MQMLCMSNMATAEGYNHSREPKNSGIDQQLTTDSAKIVATMCVQAYGNYPLISTPHPIPDAAQLLNLPLPTHELWVRAKQIHYLLSQTQATTQGPKHRKATAGSYKLNQRYPTPSNSAESSNQHKTGSEHLPQQARTEPDTYANRLQGKCRRTTHQLQEEVRKQYQNEASQQEESNDTTLTSIGAVYRRQSKKIRFDEQ
ncbi:hypothetical protein F511_13745 [Dorcoceras hygrometricum]|uniref:Uncharacterized protein n=1 Tax=Dorcoceras hygrometricum TaxID=472368 RepID=A0A2Z7CI69_9LAMI|nr:hypothetical protein F511_13745 [Dorcoceras hygrometricum]